MDRDEEIERRGAIVRWADMWNREEDMMSVVRWSCERFRISQVGFIFEKFG